MRNSRRPTSRRKLSLGPGLFLDANKMSRSGAGVSTVGLWHYPAEIVDTARTKAFAEFEPQGSWTENTAAGVINDFNGRQQMAFFISWATEWAMASNYLQHAWIHWLTRGICKWITPHRIYLL